MLYKQITVQVAALGGHEALVRVLLAGGADPNLASEHGGGAAAFAQAFGHSTIAALITAASKEKTQV